MIMKYSHHVLWETYDVLWVVVYIAQRAGIYTGLLVIIT